MLTTTLRQRLTATLQTLSPRDRLALGCLALFGVGLVFIYGLWMPLQTFHQQARAEFSNQRALYDWLQSQEQAVVQAQATQSRSAPNRVDGSPLNTVNSSAKELSLNIKRVQPEKNGDLRLWLENIPFDTSLRWLYQLEEQGLTIKELQADKVQPGVINLQLTLIPARG